MATFSYTARKGDGDQMQGTLRAKSESDAKEQLTKRGLTVVNIRKATSAEKGPKPRIKTDDMVVFTRQLATMIQAGIPLLEALEILGEQTEDKGFRWVLNKVVEDVRAGTDLSDAMSQHPKVFERIYINMVRAGEVSGQIDDILDRLAEYQEAAAELKRRIKSAMTYPVISLVMVFGITSFLMIFIVPQFNTIFSSMGVELPGITKMLLAISDWMRANWYIVLGAPIALIFLLKIIKSTEKGGYAWDWTMFHLPVFGELFRKVTISRFTRTFATLLQSGVPILGALEITASVSGNALVSEAVLGARESVRQGENLADPLQESGVFPIMVTRMIGVGEKTGALETLLEKIAEFYDQQVSAMVETLTSLIEPLLIGVMGGLVGTIVLAIFLPIFKLQESLAS